MKLPYILFFIKGPFPSKEDNAAKAAINGAKVVFRNAKAVPTENHALETCDGVAGSVPDIYAKTFPKAETAIAAYNETLKALSQKVGDVPAPKKPAATKPEGNKPPQVPNPNPPAQGAAAAKPPAWNPNPNPPA